VTDGGDNVSAVFTRLSELAIADGDVPDDRSALDTVWTRTIEARQRERDWNVAINLKTDQEQTVDGFPDDDDETTIPPGRAILYLERWPAGVVGSFGGQIIVEELEDGPRSPELKERNFAAASESPMAASKNSPESDSALSCRCRAQSQSTNVHFGARRDAISSSP